MALPRRWLWLQTRPKRHPWRSHLIQSSVSKPFWQILPTTTLMNSQRASSFLGTRMRVKLLSRPRRDRIRLPTPLGPFALASKGGTTPTKTHSPGKHFFAATPTHLVNCAHRLLEYTSAASAS